MKKLLLALFIVSSPLLADEFTISDLSGGMYSNASANKIPDNAAAYIQNFTSDIEPILVERNGYIKRDSTVLGGATKVSGLWSFLDISGNEWTISFSSKTFYKNISGGTPIPFGLSTTTALSPDAAVNLGRIWFSDGLNPLWWFDGVSTGTVSTAPKGKIIEPWRTRLVIADVPNSDSTLYFSADGDGTNWVLGGNPTDPFSWAIGGANDGQYIRCLKGSYLDSLIVGRKYDSWAGDGFDQADFTLRNISAQIGCIEPYSMQEVDGELVWLSARGMEAMNGRQIRPISEPIRNITDIIVKNTVNQRSNTQTSQDDFEAGTISPTGYLSTSLIPGAVTLAISSAVYFNDTTGTGGGFDSGSNSHTQADFFGLRIQETGIQVKSVSLPSLTGTYDSVCSAPYYGAQQFTPASNYEITRVATRFARTGSAQSYNLRVVTDSGSNTPTSVVVASATFIPSGLQLSTVTLSYPGSFNPATSTGHALLNSGTKYWLQMIPEGTCDGSNFVSWEYTTSGSPFSNSRANGSTVDTGRKYTYEIIAPTYDSTGTFTSRSFDVGVSTVNYLWSWNPLQEIKAENAPTYFSAIQTQTSSDAISWSSAVDLGVGDPSNQIISPVNRYIRYVASMTTTNQNISPIISSVSINTTSLSRSTGVFTSQLISASTVSAWGVVTISDSQSPAGTIVYFFGSTNTANVNAISNWASITNGAIPSVAVNPYAAFRSSFTITSGTQTAQLFAFKTTWSEGSAAPSPVSWIYDRRYWISFTTETQTTPILNTIYVWQRNKTWTLFKGINAASFSTWQDALYFGNSNGTGYVYKFDVGNNDDGADINSIVRTKSYDLAQFFRKKSFLSSYIGYLADPSFSGTFSLSYDIDRYGIFYPLGSANLSDSSGLINAKFPFSLNQLMEGHEIGFNLSKSGTGDRLKVGNISTIYEVKEEE